MTGVSDDTLDRLYKKSTHRRKDSGELDVFDATMYFYGGTETSLDNGNSTTATRTTTTLPRKTIREELNEVQGGRRVSLDMHMSMAKNTNATQLPNPRLENSHRVSSKQIKEKKNKQPMSPGGRLASFLNSLFNQNSKRNKKKSQSVKDYPSDHRDETSVDGMKRRCSVSHFGSLWTSDSKSFHSSSSSGFRTPPHAKSATNVRNTDVRRNSDYKQISSLDRNVAKNGIIMGSSKDEMLEIEKRKNMDLAWLDEKLKLIDGLSENNNKKNSTNPCNGLFKKDKIWIDNENDCVDGESDSSSDLFELQNFDIGLYPNGLPVYETTNIDSIKRGLPITNGHPNF